MRTAIGRCEYLSSYWRVKSSISILNSIDFICTDKNLKYTSKRNRTIGVNDALMFCEKSISRSHHRRMTIHFFVHAQFYSISRSQTIDRSIAVCYVFILSLLVAEHFIQQSLGIISTAFGLRLAMV